ncbi:MAG TPA: tRNA pseudouridine(55) synthase TruB [Gemmatimonadaceae bacterium]|nr:tRNA pseudouridine(55) synthase TruB [Gemmatimonadaceae bacterium]
MHHRPNLQITLPVRTTATDGVLLVDKPAGMTSHDVVAVARRALRTRRIGHTGTLDPFATGLLVLLVGRATRLAQFVEDEPKVYEATIRFGSETTTDDLTGETTREAPLPDPLLVEEGIRRLTGRIEQRPPDYSAKKLGGRRAYAAARAGAPLELQAASVVVHEWIVRQRTPTTLDVTITCGGGTYIRALARDLGRLAGSAAHLSVLRRTRSGVFGVEEAVSTADLHDLEPPALMSLRSAISHLSTRRLDDAELRKVQHGNAVDAEGDASLVALVDAEGGLVALAQREGDLLRPRVVIRDA